MNDTELNEAIDVLSSGPVLGEVLGTVDAAALDVVLDAARRYANLPGTAERRSVMELTPRQKELLRAALDELRASYESDLSDAAAGMLDAVEAEQTFTIDEIEELNAMMASA